jgi:hypothetical protein
MKLFMVLAVLTLTSCTLNYYDSSETSEQNTTTTTTKEDHSETQLEDVEVIVDEDEDEVVEVFPPIPTQEEAWALPATKMDN